MPTENEQFEVTRRWWCLKGKLVIIRTLISAEIRDSLSGLQRMRTHSGLRHPLPADRKEDVINHSHAPAPALYNIKIMIPLVTCIDE
ncbi:MAG: hypothetical protein ACLTC4_11555 [Hungatella hathewayi]